MSFSQGEWDAAPAPPQRSREEALALANTVAAEARARPDRFAELVERYSEDPSTRPYGGSLGGIIASQLGQWSAVLDALSSATSDGITQVVETEYGFHVFKRSPPPEQVTLTGAHIVIGYSEARWLQNQKCREISQRSREEAWAMAREVLRRLKDEPFEQLVEQYSEHCDALVGGDLGTWSNREPTHLPMEVQVLQGLAVGEVAAPVDSKFGVQIIKRMPNRKRGQYAMDPIYLGFDTAAADQHASSRLLVQREATSLARELAGDPSRFTSVKNERWRGPVEHWSEGNNFPLLGAALDQLEFGQVTPTPIEWGWAYVIARRIDPATLPAPKPTRFELPAPAAPDLEHLAAYMRVPAFDSHLRSVADQVLAAELVDGGVVAEFRRMHEGWDLYETLGRDARKEMFRTRQAHLGELLGNPAYDAYRQKLNQYFERLMLTPKGD